ncbi:hypothetical protein TWF694_005082 [Orbilia ellipsospora]|uniref:DUF7907 domain-containing protein n=1 Tax=Orbilia ellipsospora TaxID=2528407 RepID=A0AAV9WUJ0_9PEZI
MKFLAVTAASLLSLSAVSAATNSTGEFHLKTKLLEPKSDGRARFNNLIVYSCNPKGILPEFDICLSTEPTEDKYWSTSKIHYNETDGKVAFKIPDEPDSYWTLNFPPADSTGRIGWSPVVINNATTENDFLGIVMAEDKGLVATWPPFLGWMVCYWNLEIPQLFWRTSAWGEFDNKYVPRDCANVELQVEYI